MLLGVMGVALVAGGMVITWLIVTTWPVAFLAATPGLALIGYGVVLLFACAFYDDVDVNSGPLGVPTVRVRRGDLTAAPEKTPASSATTPDENGDSGGLG
jgi:hypothetical protein